MRFVHCIRLLPSHWESFRMRTAKLLTRAQFGESSFYIFERAAHPFQFSVLEALFNEDGAHFVIGEDCAIVTLGGLIEFNGVVLDVGGFELLGDTLFHIAHGLAYF